MKFKLQLVLVFALLLSIGLISCQQKAAKKPNVLLLYMDDLRPQLNCYGYSEIQSPQIDALAKNGVLFKNAYCNVAVCGASRASMLTGIRPTKNIFRNYKVFVQNDTPEAITLPQLFKNNGYTTISNGKIYHHLDDRMNDWHEVWRPYAFDKNPENLAPTNWWQGLWRDYQTPENRAFYKRTNRGPAYESASVHDSTYIDGLMTQKVLRDLVKLKKEEKPFFLTAGFISPHLPFNAPTKHWDKYPRETIKQPYNNFVAKNAPEASISTSRELRQYTGLPKKPNDLDDATAISMIHGYYATVSYVDTLIGKILAQLHSLELDKNTIVVLVSDHGYNLQEHHQWAKWTSHRTSMQVPLIIASPFETKNQTTDALVELVDLYPTLADMCGLNTPTNQLEGQSLLPILKNVKSKGKDHIFINNSNGYTIKTNQYSYTEYISRETNMAYAKMLYDHKVDPDENENVVNSEAYTDIALQLHKALHTHYKQNITGK